MRAAVTVDVRIQDAPDVPQDVLEAEIAAVIHAALSDRYSVSVAAQVQAVSR